MQRTERSNYLFVFLRSQNNAFDVGLMCRVLTHLAMKKSAHFREYWILIDGVIIMTSHSEMTRWLRRPKGSMVWVLLFAMPLAAPASPPGAERSGVPPPDARSILTRIAQTLSKAPHFSVVMNSSYDTVQPNGYKVEWNDVRKVALSRPDRLRIDTEQSDGEHSLILFDGKTITAFNESRQVYAQAPQPGELD